MSTFEQKAKVWRALQLAEDHIEYASGDAWERECLEFVRKNFFTIKEEIDQELINEYQTPEAINNPCQETMDEGSLQLIDQPYTWLFINEQEKGNEDRCWLLALAIQNSDIKPEWKPILEDLIIEWLLSTKLCEIEFGIMVAHEIKTSRIKEIIEHLSTTIDSDIFLLEDIKNFLES